jgi:4-amino-4-deoxy-L-arabinose transferase-like glycosyltransferase
MTALAPPSAATIDTSEKDGRATGWRRLALPAICLLATVLYGWSSWSSGWGNEYYSAAVKSMSRSLRNFLFGAFDPAGVLTVDKPPMALWPQVISTWIFGYHGWAVLLPQVVAGAATVFLLHRTVRRWAGEPAALIAALLLALTPIVVAINRDNNPDTLLVLLLVAAAYAFTRAIQATRPRNATLWLVFAAALIGCGFVTKMMQAWIVLPVFAAAYLACSRARWPRRLLDLLAAAAAAAVASLWWVALVDWWPGEKPYIGGSADGSAWDLVVGYNGFGRIFGRGERGGPEMLPPPGVSPAPGAPGGPVLVGGGPGGGGFGGESGITRMFNETVGGQISWLLPLALGSLVLATVAGLVARRRGSAVSRETVAGWVLWGGWLVLTALVFSFAAGIWHPYYTNMLAPAIAAVCGAGLVLLWRLYRAPGRSWVLLPGAVALTVVWAWVLVSRDTGWHGWLRYAVVAAGLLAIVLLVLARRAPTGTRRPRIAALSALLAVILAPGVWSVVTAVDGSDGGPNPLAGPGMGGRVFGQPAQGSQGRPGQLPPRQGPPGQAGPGAPALSIVGGPQGGQGGELSARQRAILDYVRREAPDTEIALLTGGAQGAAGYLINTEETVVGMGGFSGGDPAPTAAQLARWVAEGRARFVLADGPRMAGRTSETAEWIERNCVVVDPEEYGGGTEPERQTGPGGGGTLRDCAPR